MVAPERWLLGFVKLSKEIPNRTNPPIPFPHQID